MEKTPEELEAERLAQVAPADEAAAVETAQLADEAEALRVANEGKTPEQLETERLAKAEEERLATLAAKKEPSWEEKRLAKKTAEAARLAERLAQYETPDGKPKAEKSPAEGLLTEAEVERRSQEKAELLATQAAFNAACNAAAQEGRKIFPDFDASVAEMAKIVDRSDPASRAQYDEFLEAALETGEAPKIIYALGRDLNEAARIMELSPIKRAQELAVLAGTDLGQVSNLPKPMKTVQGKNAGPSEIAPDDPTRADKLSSAEWHKRRQAQLDAEAKANGTDRRVIGNRR